MKPSDDLIVSSVEPTGLNRKKVWMQKGKNLFNKDVVSQGHYLGADGFLYSSTASNVSGFIKIKAGVSYVLSFDYSSLANTGNRAYNIYNEDKKVLSSKMYTPSNKPILLTSEQNGYLRFAYDINCTDIQLEQGSTATEYEEYIEPKIYIKNDNNVYEEFVKEDSGWSSLTEIGESYAYIKYRKIGKMVELNSPLYSEKGFSISAYGTTLLGTLPEGFRPSQKQHIPIVCKNSSNSIINYCYVEINKDGTINLKNMTGSKDTAVCLVYFSTMYFTD